MKELFCAGVGIFGGAVAALFGGWDTALVTLLIFMGIDYVTGLIVAGIFHNSPKSEGGALESKAGWKGLIRKGVTLLIVLIAHRIDLMFGSTFVRDAVVISFTVNELLSIIENGGLMGVPMPPILIQAVEVLKKRADVDIDGEEQDHEND